VAAHVSASQRGLSSKHLVGSCFKKQDGSSRKLYSTVYTEPQPLTSEFHHTHSLS
jgi:hypothetical protein